MNLNIIIPINTSFFYLYSLGNETYAKSYDEFRMIENDAFIKNLKVKEEQEIVKKAAADMFDLSQLDGTNNEEIEEKEHLYRDIFTKLDTSRLKKFSLTKLNMGSIESDKNDDLSSDPFLEIVKNQSNNLRNSIKSICVADCGELVCIMKLFFI